MERSADDIEVYSIFYLYDKLLISEAHALFTESI